MEEHEQTKEQDNTEEQKIEDQTEAVQEQGEDDPVEKNWKAVREKRKEEERIRKEHEKKIKEQQEMIVAMEQVLKQQNTQTQQPIQQEDGSWQIHDEEWITGKQLKELLEKERQEREAREKQLEQQRKQQEFATRIKQNYPDYETVLNQDNLAYLEYHEPEIAASIQMINDPYLQAAMAYKQVKLLVPQMTQQDKDKMEKNKQMPPSLSDPRLNKYSGNQPNQNPGYSSRKISSQRKRELWEEMRNSSR